MCPSSRSLITKRIAAAQKAVEAQNFASRKHLLEYDDVMNKQRQAVYGMRRQLLEGTDQKERDHGDHRRASWPPSSISAARSSTHPSDLRSDRAAVRRAHASSASRSIWKN